MSAFVWRVVPWPADEEQMPREECMCFCGEMPDLAIQRGDSLWYICRGCAPLFGWSLTWPSRRSRRRA